MRSSSRRISQINYECGMFTMLYLSRDDIEKIADSVIHRYKTAYVPEKHLCYSVNPTDLAALLGYTIVYVNITKDGSILGQTSSGQIWTSILDESMNEMMFFLDGKTILIDKRLLNPSCAGRRNFTIAHELAHQILNRLFSVASGAQNRIFCDYRRSSHPRKRITDWYEWQADALAAALLLPLEVVQDNMFMSGLGDKITILSRKFSRSKYDRFCLMAEALQVSKTALAYRMEQFGLLERNLLIKEAQARKGVA